MVAAVCCDFLDAVLQAATELAAELDYYETSAFDYGDDFIRLRQACAEVLPHRSDPEALIRLVRIAARGASNEPRGPR